MSDPFRYFRLEAAELLDALTTALLALERGDDPDALRLLKRHAHTLKGAARVVGAVPAADAAHALEEVLTEDFDANKVLAHIDAIRQAVSDLPEPAAPAEPSPPSPHMRTPSVHRDETLVPLERALIAATSQIHGLRALLDEAPQVRDPATARVLRRLEEGLGHLSHTLTEANALTLGLRLVPLRAMVPALERAVRDAAQTTHKRARLIVRGGDHRVEGEMLGLLGEALDHVVRNAVVHGIEDPLARRVAGKPEEGRIELSCERRGGRLQIVCQDDGRGLHLASLPSGGDPYQVIFTPGLSTSRQVTAVSGRGVGLEVVSDIARRLGGSVRAGPSPTGGLAVELVVPISRMAVQVMLAAAAGHRAAVPLDGVVRAVHLHNPAAEPQPETPPAVHGRGPPADEETDHILLDGELLPRVRLAALFRGGSSSGNIALIVLSGGRHVALLVDALLGLREVLARPLAPAAGPVPGVAALFVDADGAPVPILDLDDLDVLARRAPLAASDPEEQQAPILVVDDSLTTRMLERSILEAAGYEVHTASSGEEALELASRRAYSLFVVDVQMPGMSGLELVRRIRQDTRLRHVPAVLVTSLGSSEDRRRGLEAGADAYIVKSAFDQEAFLGIVAGLVGEVRSPPTRPNGRRPDADEPEAS